MLKDVTFVGNRATSDIFVADTESKMEVSFSALPGKVLISGLSSRKGLI